MLKIDNVGILLNIINVLKNSLEYYADGNLYDENNVILLDKGNIAKAALDNVNELEKDYYKMSDFINQDHTNVSPEDAEKLKKLNEFIKRYGG